MYVVYCNGLLPLNCLIHTMRNMLSIHVQYIYYSTIQTWTTNAYKSTDNNATYEQREEKSLGRFYVVVVVVVFVVVAVVVLCQ